MNRKDFSLIIFFVLIGVLTRTLLHIAPNVEFITAVCLSSAIFLKNKNLTMSVPLLSLFISDLIIGNSSIYLFTWSGFLVISVFGLVLNNKKFEKFTKTLTSRTLLVEAAGILGTLFFFLWTNFGVVVVSNMYPKTPQGLALSYFNGLPFLASQLI